MAKSVQDQLAAILNEYKQEKEEQINKITKEVAEDVAKELKSTSPRSANRGKHYASGWRVKNQPGSVAHRTIISCVYNATKPQLTQLLTRAHDIKNQHGGPYGRSKPDPHIENAEKRGNEKYLHRLETEL